MAKADSDDGKDHPRFWCPNNYHRRGCGMALEGSPIKRRLGGPKSTAVSAWTFVGWSEGPSLCEVIGLSREFTGRWGICRGVIM